MSGGVDSAVAALLIKNEGFDVEGVMLRLYNKPHSEFASDENTAALIAERIGIPFRVLDVRDEFEKEVIKPFVCDYLDGKTPNPCVICNPRVKFGALTRFMRASGCDVLATGHYARIRYDFGSGRYLLLRSADRKKDQSYVLYSLTQDILSSVRFPLGEYTKPEIREIAFQNGFENADKKDSQDICFISGEGYASFIERYAGFTEKGGSFIDENGNKIGTHPGAVNFTVGQRKGFGTGFGKRVYVTAKDMRANTVTLGSEEKLYSRTVLANKLNFIATKVTDCVIKSTAKIRYGQQETPVTAYITGSDEMRVDFDEPVRAAVPGQSIVLYDGDVVIGGGIITGCR